MIFESGKNKYRILMISYFFPPLGGSATLRSLKLAKYLPSFGWEPLILAPKNPDWYYGYDRALLREIPTVNLFYVPMIKASWFHKILNPLRIKRLDKLINDWIFIPDPQAGWIIPVILIGKQIIKNYRINIIFSSSAPMSSHIVGYILKKISGIPWIADFRDEWYENPEIRFPTSFHKKLQFYIEKKIVTYADTIITCSPEFSKFLSKHTYSHNKFHTLTMGYDPEDFSKKNEIPVRLRNCFSSKKFVLLFTGTFYKSFTPANLIEALGELIKSKKLSPDNIRIIFAGGNSKEELGTYDEYGITIFTGFIPHYESISLIKNANALLLLLSNERGDYVIPSKAFEYMASRKPILAIVPPNGEVARIIKNTKTGIVADYNDKNQIKDAFLKLYNAWIKGEKFIEPNQNIINEYNQYYITKRFTELLQNIIK